MKRKNYHIAIDYQYRVSAKNLATLEEERILGERFAVHNCQYEHWKQATIAMTYSARINDENAQIQAAHHLLKMIIRQYDSKKHVRILAFYHDSENKTNFYQEHLKNLNLFNNS